MIDPVVITGAGVCSPLGHNLQDLTRALANGTSGIKSVRHFDAADHPSRMAGSIDDIPGPAELTTSIRNKSRTVRALIWTMTEALQSADLWQHRESLSVGVVLGLGSEWLVAWEEASAAMPIPHPASALETARRILKIHGPTQTLSAACASGNFALAVARQWLRLGLVDVCLAGGADLAMTPMTLAAFGNLRALSRRNNEPTKACRPFDRDRDGFVLSEGAAFVVMERKREAIRRDISMLAEVAGFGACSDAHHLVSPCPDASAASQAIRTALTDAGINADQIDYINAHGTGTPLGDVCETKALYSALGSAIETIPVSSTKSMTGHLLTASASLEALAAIAVIKDGVIPPTINLDDPDPECRLLHVANQAQERTVNAVLSNSFGFGGSNTALILKRAA